MKYQEKLLDLMLNASDEEMMAWIESQPLLEQADIFREIQQIAENIAKEKGDNVNEVIEGFDGFKKQINVYEDRILDEKLAEEQYEMALERQAKAAAEIDAAFDGVRAYVIECIVTNADNAAEMKQLAAQIIQLEKESGTYEPEKWKAIL